MDHALRTRENDPWKAKIFLLKLRAFLSVFHFHLANALTELATVGPALFSRAPRMLGADALSPPGS